ncbi:MAG: ABC transporter permease [Rhodospirillaceae bacterium]|nr:MAG: ABC transporter permease [Rhodospirillaceae bacterium]
MALSGTLPTAAKKISLGWNPVAGPMTGLLLAAPIIVMLILFLVVPVAMVLGQTVVIDGIGAYKTFWNDPVSMAALRRTIVSSIVVTLLTTGLGGILAWRLRMTRSRLVRALIWLSILTPLWMGVVVKNYAFAIILGRGGPLSEICAWLFGIDDFSLMYSPIAVILGVFYSMLPYAALPLYVTFRQIDLDLLAASEILGASRLQAITSVLLPLARPGLVATGIIVFVISIGFYITPVLLGGAKSPYLPSLIEQDLSQFYDEGAARISAAILLILATAVVGLAMKLLGARQLQRAIK